MSLLLPTPGQNPYAGPDVPDGQVNLDDVLRTLDRRTDRTFTPWDFDAVGDGEANDAEAINSAGLAAQAADGELLINGRFGFDGEVFLPGGVVVRCTATARFPNPGPGLEPGLVALGPTAQVVWGKFSDGSGSLNDNPGPIYNLVIDGAHVGGIDGARGNGLFWAEAVQTSAYDIQVMNSAGDGIVFASAQNVNLFNPQSHGHYAGAAVRWDSRIPGAQPAGHCWLFGGHQGDSYTVYHSTSPDATFFVGPHDNGAFAPICETGRVPGQPVNTIVLMEDGDLALVHPTLTIGAQATSIDEAASIVVRNEIRPAASTLLTIVEPKAIGGGAGAVKAPDLIRIEQPHNPATGAPLSAFNEVGITGTPSFANATAAGVNMSGGPAVYTCTNRPRFITAIPVHVRVTDIYSGVNGWSGFVSRSNTPRRVEVPAGAGSAFQARPEGAAANSWQVAAANGETRVLDPDTGSTLSKWTPVAGGGATLDGLAGGQGVLVHAYHCTTATRPLASLVPFRTIWNEDTARLEVSDGTSWLPVAAAGATFDPTAFGHLERQISGAQTIPNGSVLTDVAFQNVIVAASGGISYAAGVFTYANAGRYSFNGYVELAAGGSGLRELILVKTSGGVSTTVDGMRSATTTSGVWRAKVSVPAIKLAAGDTLKVQCAQGHTGGLVAAAGYAITDGLG